MGSHRRLALVATVLSGVLVIAAAVLAALEPNPASLTLFAACAGLSIVWGGLGVGVARRPGGGVVGTLLSFGALAFAATFAKEVAWQFLVRRPSMLSELDWLVAALNENAWWILAAVALLLLHFPDGRVPSSRWRWVPITVVFSAGVQQVYGAFAAEPYRSPLQSLEPPFAPPPLWLEVLGFVTFVAMLALALACVFSLVLRFRRSDPLRRVQIKWLALFGAGIPLYPLVCLAEILVFGSPGWISASVGVVSVVGIPVATAIAMLRHDLYDVDKAVAGTVTWGLVTLGLVTFYGGASFIAGLVFSRGSAAAAAGATAACALALAPLRVRLQRSVDRRLYPLRRAAFAAIETLHRDTSADTAEPESLQDVLRNALRDPDLRVGFRLRGSDAFVDADGADVDASVGTPVVLAGAVIGVIVATQTQVSDELLREVAARAATLVEVVRLRLEVARALRDVESSRTRLLQIGYEERHRLERDLHDGAQQRLVSLGMALRLAQRHLHDGTVDVSGLLDQSVAELGTAVAELRQIAHGLRPSHLDDGLQAALSALVRNLPLTAELDVCADSVPDDVATTAYYIVSEAVTNAVKHAEATCLRLSVSRDDGHLVVRVIDDGRGGATLATNSGLVDRVAALSGKLHIVSPAGQGTVVEAALPCAS